LLAKVKVVWFQHSNPTKNIISSAKGTLQRNENEIESKTEKKKEEGY